MKQNSALVRTLAVAAGLAAVLAAPALAYQGRGRGQEKQEKKDKKEKKADEADRRHTGVVVIDRDAHVRIVREYARAGSLPPGLAKREALPPGLRKQVREGGALPPGLQKRL